MFVLCYDKISAELCCPAFKALALILCATVCALCDLLSSVQVHIYYALLCAGI
jgi:hypothetical protein